MIITYLRSSSYGTHNLCPQQFYLRYVCGYTEIANQKAIKGTIVHKCLEGLARVNLAKKNKVDYIDDGETYHKLDLNLCTPDYLTELAFDFYKNIYKGYKWTDFELKECKKWSNKVVDYQNGLLDPRNLNILSCEQHFDFIIEKDWAAYSYELKGEKLEGFLGLKGTIDLLTKVSADIIEVIDYKTGKRLNWATGNEKTYEDLHHDAQLLIYFYAIKRLYPKVKEVIMTLFYINDGGPHSVIFNDKNLEEAENLIRKKFEEIKNTEKPTLIDDWKCFKLCSYGSRGKKIEGKTICQHMKDEVEVYGINLATDRNLQSGFDVGAYREGGGQRNREK